MAACPFVVAYSFVDGTYAAGSAGYALETFRVGLRVGLYEYCAQPTLVQRPLFLL